jgi:hypothetical protein
MVNNIGQHEAIRLFRIGAGYTRHTFLLLTASVSCASRDGWISD